MAGDTGEFGIIKEILSPLAAGMPGALGLTDDAACLRVEAGHELIITKDAMVAGVHFLENEKPAFIAKKLLRTNLSDLAAMGAKPIGYLMATAWTQDCDEAWIRQFAGGLKEDQDLFGVGLLGGDTVKTPGSLTLSLTAFGSVKAGTALRRNSANAGDLLYVSGTIGDGALGLQSVLGKLTELPAHAAEYLENRYRLPTPRLQLGQDLIEYATACLDISDGLLADVGHICEQSGVGARIYKDRIPLSKAGQQVVSKNPEFWTSIFGGGDDYELAFTISKANRDDLLRLAAKIGVKVTHIGEMTEGSYPEIVDESGQKIDVDHAGWTHF